LPCLSCVFLRLLYISVASFLALIFAILLPVFKYKSHQVAAFAGGEALKREALFGGGATTAASAPSRKAGQRALRDALLLPATGLPLLALTAQQRNVILFHSEAKNLKLSGDEFDRCQVCVYLIDNGMRASCW
jgi:hypothetical protein